MEHLHASMEIIFCFCSYVLETMCSNFHNMSSYEVSVIDGDNDFAIGIGFASKLPEIGKGFPQRMDCRMIGLVLHNGYALDTGFYIYRGINCEKILEENPRNGDVIGCHLQYVEKDGHRYSVCHFFRNGFQLGIYSIPATDLYPLIWAANGSKVVETNLAGNSFTYSEGNDENNI